MDNKRYAVAIDGPSGAGKSTLAKAAAAELGILYVDTGAIYRTIGLYACRRETDPHDLAAIIAMLPDIQVSMAYGEDGLQHMLLNGEDVTDVIRRPGNLSLGLGGLRHPGGTGLSAGDAAGAGPQPQCGDGRS